MKIFLFQEQTDSKQVVLARTDSLIPIVIPLMRRIPCGLSDFDENFMEQYHQKGAANDVRLKHVKNVEMKGNIVSARLRRSEHPGNKGCNPADG